MRLVLFSSAVGWKSCGVLKRLLRIDKGNLLGEFSYKASNSMIYKENVVNYHVFGNLDRLFFLVLRCKSLYKPGKRK